MEYKRSIYTKGFNQIKKQLSLETGNFHTDTYTGQPLRPGEPWDFEHIISAKEFSSLSNVESLEDETLSTILNNRKNIGFTLRTINKSKDKYSLTEWLNRKSNGRTVTNAVFYSIDISKATKLRESVLSLLISRVDTELRRKGKR